MRSERRSLAAVSGIRVALAGMHPVGFASDVMTGVTNR